MIVFVFYIPIRSNELAITVIADTEIEAKKLLLTRYPEHKGKLEVFTSEPLVKGVLSIEQKYN